MGAGIAYALVQSGSSVTLVERDDDAATAAQNRVSGLFDAAVARGPARHRGIKQPGHTVLRSSGGIIIAFNKGDR